MAVKKNQKELQNKFPIRFAYMDDNTTEGKVQEVVMMPSTLETVDYALYDFINEKLNLFTTTNEGFEKVPIIWASAERAFQIKNNKDVRDSEETLILPLITIERKSVIKEPNKRGLPWANVMPINDPKGGTITVARLLNQKKTSEFQNNLANRRFGPGNVRSSMHATNKRNMVAGKNVYETITIPLPTWVTVGYEISLRTEYQQQMNDLIQPWVTIAGNSTMPPRIERDNHKFEVFLEGNYANNSNTSNLDMTQRNYETVITANVLGYLIGDGPNQERPKLVKRQNAVEFRFVREHVVMGDIPENIDSRGFYRE
tara:strand:+ start:59 stop:1000 length:942 start_codon:yes stop_codon:yes gene_type:complete